MYNEATHRSLRQLLEIGDPGYQVLNSLGQQLGLGLWFVDLVCGILFSWGLYRLAKIQPEPWLAVLVAIPYLVIVVAMGYSRQAVAIGIIMAGMARLMRGAGFATFVPYLIVAALFHKTALVVLPLCLLGVYKQRVATTILALVAAYFLYTFLLRDSLDQMVHNYIEASYNSQGAAIRVFMISTSAVIYFIYRKYLQFNLAEEKIWRNFSLAAFFLLALLFIIPSSTAVDRLSLYILPLQLALLSRLPLVRTSGVTNRFAVILFSFSVQFIWLNYATNSVYWVPYRLYPLFH